MSIRTGMNRWSTNISIIMTNITNTRTAPQTLPENRTAIGIGTRRWSIRTRIIPTSITGTGIERYFRKYFTTASVRECTCSLP